MKAIRPHNTIYNINGKQFHVEKHRLKDMMGTDTKANPVLWFAMDTESRDYPVCGVRTLRECLSFLRELRE